MRNRSGYVLFALSILFILVITFRHPHTGGCTLGYHSGCPEPKESAPAKPRDCSNLNGSARYECDRGHSDCEDGRCVRWGAAACAGRGSQRHNVDGGAPAVWCPLSSRAFPPFLGSGRSICPPDKSSNRLVGLGRLELPTSPLSGVRSNHLSYRPTEERWETTQ